MQHISGSSKSSNIHCCSCSSSYGNDSRGRRKLVGETEMIGCHSLPLYTVKPLVLPCMYID